MDVVSEKIGILKSLNFVDKIFYAVKANNSKDIILHMIKNNIGIETVSIEELYLVKNICECHSIDFKDVKILFTPNFSSTDDYIKVNNINKNNINIIIDNIEIIKSYPELFSNREIGLRLDLDYGFDIVVSHNPRNRI